ncbi:MAG: 3-dehydroquinate synthase [Candidatus Pelagibacter sp. TMED196]|nr:MAG: 3-dehydroquinate synthase [Candidatus Pelagibacter sp. TMED196]|tara:strand:- start:6562 stop:7671 length:1110 start_codon:yes stop_codon:yes gene_type:complete
MQVDKIVVKTKERSYPIIIGNGAISLLKKQVNKLCPQTKKVAIIYDKNVPNIFKIKIKKLLRKYKIFVKDYSPKENLKSFTNVNILLEYLIKNKFNRSDLVIAVGGGIIGDFSGFTASIFKRGLNFINIPTTLLAQVDSSIGGKNGVNSKGGKNLIGSFYQPKLVISDLSFLKSLPRREFICGFGEILKYSLIRDRKFFDYIKRNSKEILNGNNLNILRYLVLKSAKNKIHFVIGDEKESNKRMTLNFGHTFAHGIESSNNLTRKINHGEAVLIGMLLATKLSVDKNICSLKTFDEVKKIYASNKLPSDLYKYLNRKQISNISKLMINDKKNNDNKINLILLKRIGKTTIPGKIKMSASQINNFLKKIN